MAKEWGGLHLFAVEFCERGLSISNPTVITSPDGHVFKIRDVSVEEDPTYEEEDAAWEVLKEGALIEIPEWNEWGQSRYFDAKQFHQVVVVGPDVRSTLCRVNSDLVSGPIWRETLRLPGTYAYMHLEEIAKWREEATKHILNWVIEKHVQYGELRKKQAFDFDPVLHLAGLFRPLRHARVLAPDGVDLRHDACVLMGATLKELELAVSRSGSVLEELVGREFPDQAAVFSSTVNNRWSGFFKI